MDVREINRTVVEQFRAGGPVEGMRREMLLLLTTRGRRTGVERTTPLMFHRHGDDLVVIASNDGAVRHPDWYLNVVADPRVVVEVGDARFAATATVAQGARREELWASLLEAFPFFAAHQAGVDREIPLVVLTG